MKNLEEMMLGRRQFVSAGFASAAMLALAACGGKPATTDGGEAAAEGEGAAEGAAADIKVGLICLHDENSTYDLNFINGFNEAMDKLGIPEASRMIKKNVPEGQECYDAAAELADAGCKAVFADSFGHEDYMIQAAKEFPEVYFGHATGTKAHTEKLPNFQNAFATIYQGRYMAGVAAGMKLKELADAGKLKGATPKMGYVGAFTYAEVVSGYTSFYLGAKSIVPEVTMDVTFTGSWYDETAEKEGATKLINGGCDLISQHADSMGAPTACENAGIPNVSYNGSTQSACPNTFIVSSRINWEPYYETIVRAIQKGEDPFGGIFDWAGSLMTDSVQLTEVNEVAAAAGTADKIAEVKKELEDGSLQVFDTSTFTVTVSADKNANAKVDAENHLTSYMADVDTDPAYEPDTEAVKDGFFHESWDRSAPYFDLQIDGINLLDTAF